MFSINGVELTSAQRGWHELFETTVYGGAGLSFENANLGLAGRDGAIAIAPSEAPSAVALRIGVDSRASLIALEALLRSSPILTLGRDGATAQATVDSATFAYAGDSAKYGGAYGALSILLSVPGIYLRDPETTTAYAAGTLDILPGLEGPITDAILRFAGPVTNPRVTDLASGTFMAYTGSVPAGSYLRMDTKLGRAWITVSDAWTGGTEVPASSLTTGPGPDVLKLMPQVSAAGLTHARVLITGGSVEVRTRLPRRI